MVTSRYYPVQDGIIHLLEGEIESWKLDHGAAMAARNLEDLVAECLSLVKSHEGLWERTRKLAMQNRLQDIEQHGKALLDLFERLVRLLQKVEKLGVTFSQQEYAIDGVQEIPHAIMVAEALRDRLHAIWPWESRPILPLNRQMVEESRRTRESGVPVEQLLSELGYQSGSH